MKNLAQILYKYSKVDSKEFKFLTNQFLKQQQIQNNFNIFLFTLIQFPKQKYQIYLFSLVYNRSDNIQIDKQMKIFTQPFWLLIIISLVLCLTYGQSPDQDEVQVGVPNYPHRFYSGYLDINFFDNKSVHYVFFESQNDVTKDPLVVWLSGGPGCSSLLGAFHQNGPFIFYPGSNNFKLNNNSWNKNSNMLYMQLPVGVGFSTTNNETANVTDTIFVEEAVAALTAFYARFQKMKKNDLFLTGHAYAAVFVTHFAKQILDRNNDPFSIFNDKWNLKGILLGNPCTRADQCYATGTGRSSKYHYQFLYNRGFFSARNYEDYQAQCEYRADSYECYQQRQILDAKFGQTNTSEYNIYGKCYRGKNDSVQGVKYVNTGCQDEAGLMNYLNDAHVQGNWNIRPKQWKPCNSNVFLAYLGGKNCYYLLPTLIQSHLRIWVYSGDLDSKIPILSTKKWIRQLKDDLSLPILKNWREWWVPGRHTGEDQVGGFIWEIEGLTFASVKGAGLRAGLDKPEAMAEVFTGFVTGKTLPYKTF